MTVDSIDWLLVEIPTLDEIVFGTEFETICKGQHEEEQLSDFLYNLAWDDMLDYYESKEEMKEIPPQIVVTEYDDIVLYADFAEHPMDRSYAVHHKEGLYNFVLKKCGYEVLPP